MNAGIVRQYLLSSGAMTAPPEIVLPERLKHLVKYCEKMCDADCCGNDAFDFSPLHVASFISAHTRRIAPSDIAEWEAELAKLEALAAGLSPNEGGFICSIVGMNQYFTRESFNRLIAELQHGIRVSPQVLKRSEELKYLRST